jgi:hypothetical protein
VTVGGVCELQPENLRVVLGLLESVGGGPVGGLGLHDGDAQVRTVPQQIVRAFAGAPSPLASSGDDPPVSECYLLIETMRIGIPPSGLELRNDELPACVGFIWHEEPKVTDRTVLNKPLYLYCLPRRNRAPIRTLPKPFTDSSRKMSTMSPSS